MMITEQGMKLMKTRQEERREQTEKEIKALAWQLMEEQGPADLSLREISRQMRMSSAAIYRYYENRNALLEALTMDAYVSQSDFLEAAYAASAGQDVFVRIADLADAYRSWALENAVKYLLVYAVPVPGYSPDWNVLLASATQSLGALIRLVVEADTVGRIREDVLPEGTSTALLEHLRQVGLSRGYALSPRALFAAFAGWTAVHGMVSLELSGQLMVFGEYCAEFFHAEVQRYIESIRND
jgi:AcrR family transcriptional regulator